MSVNSQSVWGPHPPKARAWGLLEEAVSVTTRWEREELACTRVGQRALSFTTAQTSCMTSGALFTHQHTHAHTCKILLALKVPRISAFASKSNPV